MKNKIVVLFLLIIIVSIISIFTLADKSSRVIQNVKTSVGLPSNLNNRNSVNYSAWIPYWREEDAFLSIQNIDSGTLHEINPVWYELSINGDVIRSLENDDKEIRALADDKKLKVVPTITNATPKGFDPERVSSLFKNKEEVIDKLIELAQVNNYAGWDLDLEEIKERDKETYVQFIKELNEALDQKKLTLSVTVHAQSGSDVWSGTKGQDIKSIGEFADIVRVMTYDFHNSESESGPITPTKNLIETINYTLENVEKDKVAICLPTYGYDWSNNGVVPLQFVNASNLVEEKNIEIERDEESFELTGNYIDGGISHTIWYQDSETTKERVNIIKRFGITNICFWHLGGEDSSLWVKI
jgi:spore germination protein